jgi:hypothetical protein
MKPVAFQWMHAVRSSGTLGAVDRINEILFGLIMVLTFTCSISAATAGQEELTTILWSALGCNVAWGFVDACMYLFSVLLERGETFQNVRNVRNATSIESANEIVKEALPSGISEVILDEHLSYLSQAIRNLPEPPARAPLVLHDLRQAVTIFFLVFLSTFPVTLPFILFRNVHVAVRISNVIALTLLFCAGAYLGKQTGRSKLLTGLVFAVIGMVLVFVTMALGG